MKDSQLHWKTSVKHPAFLQRGSLTVCFHSRIFGLIRYYSEHAESLNFTLVFKYQATKSYIIFFFFLLQGDLKLILGLALVLVVSLTICLLDS